MNDSILNSVKKVLGIDAADTSFDTDIIMHINSTFNILNQLGVGEDGFAISDSTSKWSDFLNDEKLNMTKSYVYAKVRKIFDPPQNSSAMQALTEAISEYEWRLNVTVDPGKEE